MPQISQFVNHQFSPVLASPTIPKMYHHATLPTNNMVTSQNVHDCGKRFINYGQNIWNHSPDDFCKVTPTISNMYDHGLVLTNNMVTSQNSHERIITSDPTIHPPNNFNNQWETFYPEPINYTQVGTSNGDGESKYQTHSLPNGNYAAHMGLVDARSETNEEKEKGPCVGTKKIIVQKIIKMSMVKLERLNQRTNFQKNADAVEIK
ncbi:unnamed protein product [Eruca vesicaria subsp. sativa]|uniref:Uncharacterized protein n=1 Tax=Eruca vesicaria subsp. sativa TaxID=29727 RepID=A0ABC8JGG5_ERUVS|nr:unnamed protein product [Eruca vesicaria subsp. sativa]